VEKLIQHYEILEAKKDDSIEQIKQKYRDLVIVWHPDRFQSNPRLQSNAQEKMKELNAAFEYIESFFKTNGKPSFKENDQSERNMRSVNQDNSAAPTENNEFIYYEKTVYDKRLSLTWPRNPQVMSDAVVDSLVYREAMQLKLRNNLNELNKTNYLNKCNWRLPNAYEMVSFLKRIKDLSEYSDFMFSTSFKEKYFTNSYCQSPAYLFEDNTVVTFGTKSGRYSAIRDISTDGRDRLYWPVLGELENEICGICMGNKVMPGLLWGTDTCSYCTGTGKNTLLF